jgi:hypothetical protein
MNTNITRRGRHGEPLTQVRFDVDTALRDKLAVLAREHDRTATQEMRAAMRAWITRHTDDDTPAAS